MLERSLLVRHCRWPELAPGQAPATGNDAQARTVPAPLIKLLGDCGEKGSPGAPRGAPHGCEGGAEIAGGVLGSTLRTILVLTSHPPWMHRKPQQREF